MSYITGDHLGSSTTVTADTNPGVVSRTKYYPYGSVVYQDVPIDTDKLFTGQRRIAQNEVYDYGARTYNAYTGRFMQADTIVPEPGNPQALNRYSYVLNNPLRYTDPTGHRWMDDGGGCTSCSSGAGGGGSSPSNYTVPVGVAVILSGGGGTAVLAPALFSPPGLAVLGLATVAIVCYATECWQSFDDMGDFVADGVGWSAKQVGSGGQWVWGQSKDVGGFALDGLEGIGNTSVGLLDDVCPWCNLRSEGEKDFGEVVNGLEYKRSGRAVVVDADDPGQKAQEVFDDLKQGAKEIQGSTYSGGSMWERSDGSRVGLRTDQAGNPTIDVGNNPISSWREIKFVTSGGR